MPAVLWLGPGPALEPERGSHSLWPEDLEDERFVYVVTAAGVEALRESAVADRQRAGGGRA